MDVFVQLFLERLHHFRWAMSRVQRADRSCEIDERISVHVRQERAFSFHSKRGYSRKRPPGYMLLIGISSSFFVPLVRLSKIHAIYEE